jgi:hypothetical protein
MGLAAKTNSLICYEEKAGVLGVKVILTLLVAPHSQANRRNG